MKFYYVYIIKSIHFDFIYVGYSESLKNRYTSHNKGENQSTKSYAPFDLIHYEAYRNKKDAKRREDYFKTTKGKATIKIMLKEYLNELKK